MIATLLFTIQVTAEPRNSGDGNNEIYIAQAVAPNGEKLHYHGEGPTLFAALDGLAQHVRRHKEGTR